MDREQIARDNIRIIDYFLDLYHIQYKEDEIKDLLYIAFTQALNDYDPAKGKFTTLAMQYMKRLYFRELRVNKYPKRDTRGITFLHLDADASMGDEDTLLGELVADPNVNVEKSVLDEMWVKDTVANIIEVAKDGKYPLARGGARVLTKKQYKVFESIYIDGMTKEQAARKLHLKKQSVYLIDRLIIKRLSAWFRNNANRSRVNKSPELVWVGPDYFKLLDNALVSDASGLIEEDADYVKEIIKGSE